MLNFILYNHTFEYLILTIAAINYIFLLNDEIIEIKDDFKQFAKLDAITKYKITSTFFTIIYLSIIIVFFAKEVLLSLILFIVPFISLIKSLIDTYRNKNNTSANSNYTFTGATLFFVIFLSAYATPVYFILFAKIKHITKEILLIMFLISKIVLFTFLFATNLFTLLSNITTKLNKSKKLITYLQVDDNQYFSIISYNFLLFKKYKNKLTKILDNIIFFILCPFTIIINIICIIYLKIVRNIKINFLKLLKFITKNFDNKNTLIKKITTISIILSLVIMYIITIVDSHLFSNNISQIYSFISTVILIPFIYDSIKSK